MDASSLSSERYWSNVELMRASTELLCYEEVRGKQSLLSRPLTTRTAWTTRLVLFDDAIVLYAKHFLGRIHEKGVMAHTPGKETEKKEKER